MRIATSPRCFRLSVLLLAAFAWLGPNVPCRAHDLVAPFSATQSAASQAAQQAARNATRNEKVAAALRARLEQLVESGEVPGASVAVILPDGSEVAAVAGLADKAASRAVTPDDRFCAGSVGKTFFAAMAVDLLTSGKLSLDDHVSKYLGETDWYPQVPHADELTIAHLMRHQSGLPRYVMQEQLWRDLVANPDKVWTPADRLAYIREMPAIHETGQGWAYSDTNYIVLGAVLEKIVAGDQAAADKQDGSIAYAYLQKHVLDPHHLDEIIAADHREIAGMAQGYGTLFGELGVPELSLAEGKFAFNPQFEWCGGGFITTPRELARWARLNYTGQTFKQEYLPLMLEGAAQADPRMGGNLRYGLGVMIRDTPAGTWLGHDGVYPGYLTSMGYYPDKQIAAAFQVNTDNGRALRKAQVLLLTELVLIAEKAAAE